MGACSLLLVLPQERQLPAGRWSRRLPVMMQWHCKSCTVILQPPAPVCQSPWFALINFWDIPSSLVLESWKRVSALVWSGKLKTSPPIKTIKLKDLLLLKFASMLWCLHALLLIFSICILSSWFTVHMTNLQDCNTRGYPSRSWEWCLSLGVGYWGTSLSWRLQALKSTLVWTLEGSSVHFTAAAHCIPE